MISTISPVPPGKAMARPLIEALTPTEEAERLVALRNIAAEERGGDEELMDTGHGEDGAEGRMNGESEDESAGDELAGGLASHSPIPGLVFDDNAKDPYMTVPDSEDKEDEQIEDFILYEDDIPLCIGRCAPEFAYIDVYVYNPKKPELFFHHSLPVGTYPLSTCWMGHRPGMPNLSENRGSTLFVSSFGCGIELWDLDTLDIQEPTCSLGGLVPVNPGEEVGKAGHGRQKGKQKGRQPKGPRKQTKPQFRIHPDGHQAEVIQIQYLENNGHPIIVSVSADKSVRVWDAIMGKCLTTISNAHGKEVTSCRMRQTLTRPVGTKCDPLEGIELVTGGNDRFIHTWRYNTGMFAKTGTYKASRNVEHVRYVDEMIFIQTEDNKLELVTAVKPKLVAALLLPATPTCSDQSEHDPHMFAVCCEDNTISLVVVKDRTMSVAGTCPVKFEPRSASFVPGVASMLCVGGAGGELSVVNWCEFDGAGVLADAQGISEALRKLNSVCTSTNDGDEGDVEGDDAAGGN